ncbi:MAG: desulfoferrodoxin [Coxiella sp. DG_40]|nr:MAG: desulfoferrodoxin [Coxiella sp. DG_40]
MVKLNNIYKCNVCGNIIQILHPGEEALVCCDQPMEKLSEQDMNEALAEIHVPIIKSMERGLQVTVSNTPHPMEQQHYIEWIELIADGRSYRKYLHFGEEAKVSFCVKAKTISARTYCNIHGLWKGEM